MEANNNECVWFSTTKWLEHHTYYQVSLLKYSTPQKLRTRPVLCYTFDEWFFLHSHQYSCEPEHPIVHPLPAMNEVNVSVNH